MRFNRPQLTEEQRRQMQAAGRRRGGFGVAGGQTAGPGRYLVTLTVNGRTYANTLTIRDDPGLNEMK